MIYLDNAATSFPKPDSVLAAVQDALANCTNAGRGHHRSASLARRMIQETRALLADFFNAPDPTRMVFCLNATDALNMAIKGFLQPGAHVVTTPLEHNSVLRPLHGLQRQGRIELTMAPLDARGILDPGSIQACLRPRTELVVITHVSNVLGTLQPVAEVSQLCHERGVPLLLDAAQSAGHLPVDVEALGVDMMAFSGHKGLLGPPGCGGLYVHPDIRLHPWREGGTGTESDRPLQPEEMPEHLEAGTHNLPAIAGMAAGIQDLRTRGWPALQRHQHEHMQPLVQGLSRLPGVTLYGGAPHDLPTGALSFNIQGLDCADVGMILDESFGIAVRTGLHCAPEAHRAIATFPQGTVRVSPGTMTTLGEIDTFISAVKQIVTELDSEGTIPCR